MTDLEKALLAYGGIQYAKFAYADELIEALASDHEENARHLRRLIGTLETQEAQIIAVIERLSCDGGVHSVLCCSQKYIYDLL